MGVVSVEEIDIKDFIRFYFNKIIYVIVAIMVVVVGGNVYNIFFLTFDSFKRIKTPNPLF